ncbi:GNAT family N-acetyltransferase [Flavobacterium terrisoli]|uniref:GNAT family N-acetyltransferase n=1 Tax=Flavobacterium terrisoli TaxID=3242195 RepID=UPI0025427FAC|nr:GNAT family N-acetyltransferase [Flavobacterium buctense]
MITLTRTTSDNKDFQKLTRLFDEYLVDIDGDEKDFFAQYNQIYLDHVIVCDEDGLASGCGAFKQLEPQVAEIKRMFVLPEQRGKGIAASILSELENWAKDEGYTSCILETSNKLESAIALYKKSGYEVIPNYGQYIGVESSVCMRKII